MDSNAALKLSESSLNPLKQYPKGYHPNSVANLKPILPGEVKNPNGRPAYKDILEEALPKKERSQILQRLAKQEDNLNVSLAATKYIDDRIEGPVPQQLNVSKLSMSIDFSEVQHTLEQLQGHNSSNDMEAIDITSTILESEE